MPIPRTIEVALAVQGVAFVVLGAVLFIAPRFEGVIWPWALTPLTARVVAAWLLAFGFGAVLALRDRNLARLDVAAVAYAVLAVLELVVLVRFPDVIRWQSAATWVFLVLMSSMAASSAYALWWLGRLGKAAELVDDQRQQAR